MSNAALYLGHLGREWHKVEACLSPLSAAIRRNHTVAALFYGKPRVAATVKSLQRLAPSVVSLDSTPFGYLEIFQSKSTQMLFHEK